MDDYCENIQNLLADYILGILKAEDCDQVNKHINQCPACRQYKQTLEDENLVLKQFHLGFEGQPVAHALHFWNFAGMTLSGLAFALAGGCPGRQLFLAGEGDGDAAVFVLGMIVGAGFAHNFGLASSPNGLGAYGVPALIAGLVFCLFVGFMVIRKNS